MARSKKLIYLIFDFIALNTAFAITQYWLFKSTNSSITNEFKVIVLLVNLLWFSTLFYSNRLYKQFEYVPIENDIKAILPNFIIYVSLFYILSMPFFRKEDFSFSFYFGLLLILLIASRILLKVILSRVSKYKKLNYISIGYCDALSKIEDTLNRSHLGKVHYLGSFGRPSRFHRKYLGSVEQIIDFLQENNVNLILYVSNTLSPDMLRNLMHYAKHNFIELKIIPLEMDYLTEGARLELHDGFFLGVKDEFVTQVSTSLIKRVFDIMFSTFVIVFILSWLFPILCLLIVLESKGSPIFIQDRVGFRGKTFKCIKFRSLTVQENGMSFKQVQSNDSRITKIGAFIRKTNLDEMPQFLNVFLGDMSIVGPRPHPVKLDIELKNATEEYSLRYYTKPGITGWAQVNGWRGPTDTEEKIINRTQFDIWYLQNRSFLLDIKIIFLTVFGSKAWENAF